MSVTCVSPPPAHAVKVKYIFWYPCPLYPIRTENSRKRRSCLLGEHAGLCSYIWTQPDQPDESCSVVHEAKTAREKNTACSFQRFPEAAIAGGFLHPAASNRSSVTCATSVSCQWCHASITTPHESNLHPFLSFSSFIVCFLSVFYLFRCFVNSNADCFLPTLAETRTNKTVVSHAEWTRHEPSALVIFSRKVATDTPVYMFGITAFIRGPKAQSSLCCLIQR